MVRYFCDVCNGEIQGLVDDPYILPKCRREVEYNAWGELSEYYHFKRTECYLCDDCACAISKRIWRVENND